jgi:opacity protein-like surface antigen
MHRLCSLAALLLALGLLGPTTADAQTNVQLGPRLGIPVGDVSDAGGDLFLGADARIETQALPVVINPSFDFYFMDDLRAGGRSVGQSLFTIDVNALYEFGVDNQAFTPYAGGGLGITRYSIDADFRNSNTSDTDVGLNIVGGARFPLGSVQPFAQLNAAFGGDWDRLGITGGVLFQL